MALTQVSSEGIKDAQVKTADILDANITTAKVADNAITGAKVADNLDIPDNNKIRFGTGNDLELYHDGSHSILKDAGTGNLRILTNNLRIENAAGTENQALFTEDGSVELYHNNAKKLETTSAGVTVTGEVSLNGNLLMNHADNHKIFLGAGDDLQIYASGSHSVIAHNGDGNLQITTGASGEDILIQAYGDIDLKPANGENGVKIIGNGAVSIYHDNGVRFTTQSWGTGFDANFGGNDNIKLLLGNGDDLQIYHNGSHNYLVGVTSGQNTYIGTNGGEIQLQPIFGSEHGIIVKPNAAVELYYDNSKKFETYASGTLTTGNLKNTGSVYVGNQVDGHDGNSTGQLFFGASNDLKIYHDGSHSLITDSGTGNLRVQTNNLRIENAAGTENQALFTENGAVELYYDNAKKFETTSTGILINGRLQFTPGCIFDTAANGNNFGVSFNGDGLRPTNGSGTETNNSYDLGNASYRWRNLLIGNDIDVLDNGKILLGDGDDLEIYHDGNNSFIKASGTGSLNLYGDSINLLNKAASEYLAKFISDGAVELYYDNSKKLETNGSGVLSPGYYVTAYDGDKLITDASQGGGSDTIYIGNAAIQVSSDQRIKKDIINTTLDATTKLKQVRVVDYTWNDPSDKAPVNRNSRGTWTGCLAQEMVNIFPYVVNAPRKDDNSVDTESEKKWTLEYQHLVPALIKGFQEQQAEIETLKTKVAALEAG